MCKDVHFLMLSIQQLLPTTASPTLQGARKDCFGEAVVACEMPEPRKIPSLDSCRKRFMWTDKEADFALHTVVGLFFITVTLRGAGRACWLEHRTRDRKAASSSPDRSGGRIFFSRVNFVC